MSGCVYKLPDGRCDKPGRYLSPCIGEACSSATPSNYDLLISKTPEELAEHICCPYGNGICIDLEKPCKECVLDWLKAPAKREDEREDEGWLYM